MKNLRERITRRIIGESRDHVLSLLILDTWHNSY